MKLSIHKATTLAAAALALPLAMAALPAQAIVLNWQYDVASGFTDYENEAGTQNGIAALGSGLGGNPTELQWGPGRGSASGDYSSISVDDGEANPPLLVTNTNGVVFDVAANDGAFSHNNQPIPNGSVSLSAAQILTQLILTPTSGSLAGSQLAPSMITFNINFKETFNGGACAYSGGNPCDDVFVLEPGSSLTSSFTYDGVQYTTLLEILGLQTPLPAGACTDAGVDPGCDGILTQENQNNWIDTRLSITAAPLSVPAPGTLSILALGLLCLILAGFSRSRRAG